MCTRAVTVAWLAFAAALLLRRCPPVSHVHWQLFLLLIDDDVVVLMMMPTRCTTFARAASPPPFASADGRQRRCEAALQGPVLRLLEGAAFSHLFSALHEPPFPAVYGQVHRAQAVRRAEVSAAPAPPHLNQ